MANTPSAANGDHKASQRRSRELLTEERRIQTLWWRMPLPLNQCRRREAEEGGLKGRGQGEPWVPSARFFGSFLCEAQRNEHKFLNQRALCAAVCRRAKKFLLTYAHPATTRTGRGNVDMCRCATLDIFARGKFDICRCAAFDMFAYGERDFFLKTHPKKRISAFCTPHSCPNC